MKAVRCHRFAGTDEDGKPVAQPDPLADVLSIDQIPRPDCGDDDVLIEVNYAGIQYPDALQAQGLYQSRPPLPYIPGMDVTGTVAAVGNNVSHVAVGDQVVGQLQIGGSGRVRGRTRHERLESPCRCASIQMRQRGPQLLSPPIIR